MRSEPPRWCLMIAFEDCQILDVTGPMEILAGGNDLKPASPPYLLEIAAPKAGAIRTTAGLRLMADRAIDAIPDAELSRLDTLLVSGGDGTRRALGDTRLISFIEQAARHAHRVVSICSGTFLLGAAGLLKGKRVTTHWNSCDALERFLPDTKVERDAIFVRDGNIWSSAGITAGMDLALALVEEDLGREAALAVAQRHVMFMMRPGGQSQFSAVLDSQAHEKGRLGRLLAYIKDHPQADLSLTALAETAAMSERTLLRVFNAEMQMTPARYIERVRVDHARRLLSATDLQVERVAQASGFGAAETMRRAFHRHLGISPAEFRQRFSSPLRRQSHEQDDRNPSIQ